METEGFIFMLLIMGVYSSLLGSNILLKEENDKTIEYLISLPVRRNDIVLNKVLVGLIYVILMPIILGVTNYVSLSILEEFDKKVFILLSLTPILCNIVLFSLSFFIGVFTHKSKKILPLSIGIVFISYILSVLSQSSESIEFLKCFSIYTLADTRGIITNNSINVLMIIIALILSILFIFLTSLKYNKKELV